MLALLVFILLIPIGISVGIQYFIEEQHTNVSITTILITGMILLFGGLALYLILYFAAKRIYLQYKK